MDVLSVLFWEAALCVEGSSLFDYLACVEEIKAVLFNDVQNVVDLTDD